MSNWVYLATDWPRQKRQSSVGGFQNQPRNWPPVPSGAGAGQTAVLGPKLGRAGHLAKQSSWAAGLKISSPLRLMFAPCVHKSWIPLQFQACTPVQSECCVQLYNVNCKVCTCVWCIFCSVPCALGMTTCAFVSVHLYFVFVHGICVLYCGALGMEAVCVCVWPCVSVITALIALALSLGRALSGFANPEIALFHILAIHLQQRIRIDFILDISPSIYLQNAPLGFISNQSITH